jgi:hypothetical protein
VNRLMFPWVVFIVVAPNAPGVADEKIRNYVAWTDTDGKLISCHDGGITRVGDIFYWYGTSYKGN